MKRRPRKRTLLMVLLLLTAGAIINVAVAWGCATSLDLLDVQIFNATKRIEEPERYTRVVIRCQRTGAVRVISRKDPPVFPSTAQPELLIPNWSNVALEQSDPSEPLFSLRMADGRGWPLLSMWSCTEALGLPPHKLSRINHGILIEDSNWRQLRVLPLGLIWPGFAINTIFYAAILWLLFAAPGFVRRRLRIKRGQCPACAYPVGTSEVCTECGGPVRSRGDAADI